MTWTEMQRVLAGIPTLAITACPLQTSQYPLLLQPCLAHLVPRPFPHLSDPRDPDFQALSVLWHPLPSL